MAYKVKKVVDWVDSHPRTGWYVATYGCIIVTAHLVIDVVLYFVG